MTPSPKDKRVEAALEPIGDERLRWAWETAGEVDDARREEAVILLEAFVGRLMGWHGGDEESRHGR